MKINNMSKNINERISYATRGHKKRFCVLLALFLLVTCGGRVWAQILNEGSSQAEIDKWAKDNPSATPKQLRDYMDTKTVKISNIKITVGYLSENGAFTDFMNDMVKFAKKGMATMKTPAKSLLCSLILIDFIVVVSQWALGDHNRLGDLFWRFIKWGIFVWIIGDFENLVETFFQGFITIGQTIGGRTSALLDNPSTIFTTFYEITVKPLLTYVFSIEFNFSMIGIIKNILTFQAFPVLALCTFFLALVQLVLIVLLAAQVVSTVAIYWFCAAIGFILFPFLMLDQTRILSGNTISALMGGGARMAVLTAVLGLGNGLIVDAIEKFGWIASGDNMLVIALQITAYLALFCWASIKLPSVVAAAVAGQGGGGMGIASGITKIATIGR